MTRETKSGVSTFEEHEEQLRRTREQFMDWSIRIANGETDPFGSALSYHTTYIVDCAERREVLKGICHALARPSLRRKGADK